MPVAGHTRPPSFFTVTVVIRVSPAVQARETLSEIHSASQSAERNHWSRKGVL